MMSIHLKAIFLNSIRLHHIREVIEKNKSSKRFGSDNIPSYFLKLAFTYMKNFLVLLFITSIEAVQLPEKWKVAKVTPLFKDGDRACKTKLPAYFCSPSGCQVV